MAEYDNTNRGAIWKNDKKTEEKHPDFRGELNVEGSEYWVSAWKRKPGAKESAPPLTFALTLKESNVKKPVNSAPAKGDDLTDEEIPF